MAGTFGHKKTARRAVALFLLRGSLSEQVGAQAAGSFETLRQFPLFDLGFVAGKQDFGHFPPFVVGRACVDRGGEKVVLERITQCALLVGEHSGHETYDGVGHDCRGKFASSKYKVADADFFGDEVLADSVVNALVVAAKYDDVFQEREGIGHGLVEFFSVGRSKNDFVVGSFGFEGGDACIDGAALHHHAGKASERVVVDATVLVGGEIPKVVEVNLYEPLLAGTAQDGSI